jgi:CRISPR/Cas system-associated endonuclease/helicase Cas3
VTDESSDSTISTPFRYHLELSPAQLKIVHTALRSLLDDFGHDQPEIHRLIHELLAKLPDEHAIRAIQLDIELEREEPDLPSPSDDGPPPSAA